MGELSALGRPDIDLGAGVIHVHRNWDALEGYIATKNRKARNVPVPAILRDYLDEYLLTSDGDEHVFGLTSVGQPGDGARPQAVDGSRAARARPA